MICISINKLFKSFRKPAFIFTISIAIIFCFILASCSSSSQSIPSNAEWVATWSTAPQLVEVRNNPPEPGLSNNTLRQVLRVSLGGEKLRMKFSNVFSSSPVVIHSVHIALSLGGSKIDTKTDYELKFSGKPEITIDAGKDVTSDPFDFKVSPLTNVTVTIFYGSTPPDITGHPGSRTTSYILTGNHIADKEFPDAVTTEHWYNISTIDVIAPESAGAIAILGNSITDGRGSGTNKQNRWTDELANRLQANSATKEVAVLNEGIGGNCVLQNCLGPSAVSRFERDVLNQSNVRWVIILEGINDIGGARGADRAGKVADGLIDAYKKFIEQAHAKGLKIYGATMTPFATSFYDGPERQDAWKKVNDWIRTSGSFDAVIDFAKAMEDPQNPGVLDPNGDTGDHLHPNEVGYRNMAAAIDLSLFEN